MLSPISRGLGWERGKLCTALRRLGDSNALPATGALLKKWRCKLVEFGRYHVGNKGLVEHHMHRSSQVVPGPALDFGHHVETPTLDTTTDRKRNPL